MSGLRECADYIIDQTLRDAEESEMELETPAVPRQICPPKRYIGNAPSHKSTGPREFFRVELVKMVDTAFTQLEERFESEGITELEKFEKLLLEGHDMTQLEAIKRSLNVWPAELDIQDTRCILVISPDSCVCSKLLKATAV